MARQSAAALAVVGPGVRRPEPAAGLTVVEADLWRKIVATKPGDWFTHDTHPLLSAYCRAVSASEVIAQQIERFEPEWLESPEGLLRYDKLMQMQARQATLIAHLGTKMRITQQSKYGARGAESAARHAFDGTKPWQRTAKEA